MKKFILVLSMFVLILGNTVWALETKATVTQTVENSINILVTSQDKIRVTGYTISKGSSIIVYYINSAEGTNSDSITVNLSSVIKPYRVILVDGDKSPAVQPFVDIASHPMRDYIRHLHDTGFVEGYGEDNTFKPDNNITRGEFLTILVRMLNLNEKPEFRKSFDDLDQNHWAYQYAIKAIDNGLIDGYEEGGKRLIKLDNNITLAEASKIITDAFNIQNNSVANYDVRFVGHWAKSYIQELLNEDVISPNDEFYISGEIDKEATRGEIARFLSRTIGR